MNDEFEKGVKFACEQIAVWLREQAAGSPGIDQARASEALRRVADRVGHQDWRIK